ncbi:MAG: A24 family peptidase C-terminal domain-containing protein [Methanomassiliicoccus sp.]|nr:A24 family peptidase C-terminal domain-containing protein [Methanomassiliicoccus sp.]
MDWMPLLKVTIAMVALVLAARADWRTREASDAYWIIIGGTGMVFLVAQVLLDGEDLQYLIILLPIAIFFADIFWERKGIFEDGVNVLPLALYLVGFAVLGWMVFEFNAQLYFWELMIIPIMFLVFILLYQFDVIKGGADAKALIALTIMFPTYFQLGPFPLIAVPFETAQFMLPFPLLVLFNAALLTLAVPVFLLILNSSRRQFRFPAMLFGYVMPIAEAREKYVWPMERVEDGQRKLRLFPGPAEDTANELDALAATGAQAIWVTPKVPFLIPITASLAFSVVVGNLLFLFLG